MRLLAPLLATALLSLALPACSPYPDNPNDQTINKENRLSAAGFKKKSIASEAQLADFRSIPAHLIRPATYKGKIVYVYADPSFCGCLYVGSTAAYNSYIENAQTKFVRAEVKSSTTDSGFDPPYMLDGGPWDDAEMYGLYLN